MQLIIESGSTKADWKVFSNKEDGVNFTTHGLNPSTMPDLDIVKIENEFKHILDNVSTIYFYGAGINGDKSIGRIDKWLRSNCSSKADIYIAEDSLAAARACHGDQEGFVGILGTGSNSSFYNGKSITNLLPTLGYMISDEGGGTYLGKEILRAYFYNHMPPDIKSHFEANYLTDRSEITHKLYQENQGNRFLASYASLLTDIRTGWTKALVRKCILLYLKVRIIPFYNQPKIPLSFVGSIAYYHQDILAELCTENSIYLKEVIHKPLNRLLEYHLSLQ